MTVVTADALENCEVPEGLKRKLDNASTRRPSVIGDVSLNQRFTIDLCFFFSSTFDFFDNILDNTCLKFSIFKALC